MKVSQKLIKSEIPWGSETIEFDFYPDLILCFISPKYTLAEHTIKSIMDKYPGCVFAGCSTAGEILGDKVCDDAVALTAIKFNSSNAVAREINISSMDQSYNSGKKLMESIHKKGLKHVLVFSDGLNVNGAELVEGLTSAVSEGVSITGGLAGDGSDFEKTFVVSGSGISGKKIVAIGLYGSDLKIGYGSKGGWDSFGIERLVSKSKSNILYELDGQPALGIYKSYLGQAAKDLPGSGLLFPLCLRINGNTMPVVRTILAVNEGEQSLTFAGNVPQGSYARLMKANIDRLINGAQESAKTSHQILKNEAELSILISCVGRRLVLKQMVEEEVEAVKEIVGKNSAITGFYSYGEIAPFGEFNPCQLHNQTMTITTFSE